MRVLVVGLGSMGKRRVRNLRALGIDEIVGFDPREDRRAEAAGKYQIATFDDFERAMSPTPSAIVISTPPELHVDYALRALSANVAFFTEAGIPDRRLEELIARLRSATVTGVPSCTMRYYPGPRSVKRVLKDGVIGKPYLWVYHSGQYLPDWHPWETIDAFYAGKRETGGCREIVAFEFAWLVDVFGSVSAVDGRHEKLSDLPVDIDDVYQLQVKHETGIAGQLTVDVL